MKRQTANAIVTDYLYNSRNLLEEGVKTRAGDVMYRYVKLLYYHHDNLGSTMRMTDAGTGLYYYNVRYYDPETGRFTR